MIYMIVINKLYQKNHNFFIFSILLQQRMLFGTRSSSACNEKTLQGYAKELTPSEVHDAIQLETYLTQRKLEGGCLFHVWELLCCLNQNPCKACGSLLELDRKGLFMSLVTEQILTPDVFTAETITRIILVGKPCVESLAYYWHKINN